MAKTGFHKSNLKTTFAAVVKRRAEISEFMEWYDGEGDDQGAVEEAKFLNAICKTFTDIYGTTPTSYFCFDDNGRDEDRR